MRGCWRVGWLKLGFFCFFSLLQTHNCRETPRGGLTERAASNLLKLDHMKVATQPRKKHYGHLGTQTANHMLIYGSSVLLLQCLVLFMSCPFSTSTECRLTKEIKVACTFCECKILPIRQSIWLCLRKALQACKYLITVRRLYSVLLTWGLESSFFDSFWVSAMIRKHFFPCNWTKNSYRHQW